MAKPSSDTTGGPTCVYTNCDKTNTTCVYTCARSDPFLSPPPLPPPPSTNAVNSSNNNNAVAPYLIATVCFLGISFLLLTTCTIILRYRFSRRQTLPRDPQQQQQPPGGDHTVFDHPVWHVTTTVGLQQSVIDSITTFKYKKIDGVLIDGCDCSVCLTEFIDGDDLRLLPKCCHAFHVVCIDTWLRSHRNCPLCRAPVVNEDPGAGPGREGELHGRNNEEEINDIESGSNDGHVSDHGSSCHLRETGENEEWDQLCHKPETTCSYWVKIAQILKRNRELGVCSDHGSCHLRETGENEECDQLCRKSEITCSYWVKIAQILKRNRELGICSDLGVKYRFRGVDGDGGGDVEPIRRSYSFNCSTGDGICKGLGGDLSLVGNDEGCSSNSGSSENKGEKIDAEKVHKWSTSSVYGLLWKTSSFGRSLQKGPVSMKRSFSSGGKLFSFRRTKTNSSILPL